MLSPNNTTNKKWNNVHLSQIYTRKRVFEALESSFKIKKHIKKERKKILIKLEGMLKRSKRINLIDKAKKKNVKNSPENGKGNKSIKTN